MIPEVAALQRAVEAVHNTRLREKDDPAVIREAIRLLGEKLEVNGLRADYPEIAALRKAGLTHAAIAERVGCSESNVRRVLKKLDVTPRVPKNRFVRADVLNRHRDGESLRALAAEYGVSHSTVARWIADARTW